MMSQTRKVVVNGTEYEVELVGEGTTWKATVGGQSFDIELPEACLLYTSDAADES